jgi:hypothetical protein
MSGDLVAGLWAEEGSGSGGASVTSTDYSANDSTLTCAAENIQGPIDLPYPSILIDIIRAFQSIFYFLIIFGGLFLNSVVIILVAKYKQLRTLSFLVSLQIVVLDLILALTLVSNLVTSVSHVWLFGEYMCAITGFIETATAMARTLLMNVFVIDRFLSVFCPYFYPRHNKKIMVSLSVACWVFAVLISVPMLPGVLDCYRFVDHAKGCLLSSICNQNCSLYVRIYGGLILPITIFPIILYAVLFTKGRKLRREYFAGSTVPEAISARRNDRKALITFALLFVSVCVLIIPTTLLSVSIAAAFHGDYPAAAYVVQVFNSLTVVLLIVTDPIVIMRDRDVKDVLVKVKNSVFHRRPIADLRRPSMPLVGIRQPSTHYSGVRFSLQYQRPSVQHHVDITVPTVDTTAIPTVDSSAVPTVDAVLTVDATSVDAAVPTVDTTVPTVDTTTVPTVDATAVPTVDVTSVPTVDATAMPTVDAATAVPTVDVTAVPTLDATAVPTVDATAVPTVDATAVPTVDATAVPTVDALTMPTVDALTMPTVDATSVATTEM